MGQLAVDGMQNRDGPVMVGCTLLSALFIVFATMTGDLVSALLDPRIRPSRVSCLVVVRRALL